MDLVGFFYGFGFLQGLILTAVLLFGRSGNRLSNTLMAGLVAFISVHLAFLWMVRTDLFIQHPQLGVAFGPLKYLWGPLLYLYAYTMTRQSVSRWHLAHVIPCLFMYIPVLVFSSYAHEEQVAFLGYFWRSDESDVSSAIMDSVPRFWQIWVDQYLHGTLFALHFGIYCYLVLRLIRHHNSKLKQHFSSLEQMNLRWLRTLTTICLAFLVIYLLFNRSRQFFLGHIDIHATLANAPFLFLVVGIYIIGFMALYQPNILRGVKAAEDSAQALEADTKQEPEESTAAARQSTEKAPEVKAETPLPEKAQQEKPESDVQEVEAKPVKYKRSTLSPEDAEEFSARLIRVIQEEELYLDSELTMPELARRADLAPYQVSQVLNGPMNQSFFSFVNYYRIELAKQMMADPNTRKLAIVDLAMEVGFKSKSSFYDAFKKSTQMTPTQFKKSLSTEPVDS